MCDSECEDMADCEDLVEEAFLYNTEKRYPDGANFGWDHNCHDSRIYIGNSLEVKDPETNESFSKLKVSYS